MKRLLVLLCVFTTPVLADEEPTVKLTKTELQLLLSAQAAQTSASAVMAKIQRELETTRNAEK